MTPETLQSLGVGVAFAFLRWRFPAVPKHAAEGGVLTGIILLLLSLAGTNMKMPSMAAAALLLLGLVCIGGFLDLWLKKPESEKPASENIIDKRSIVDNEGIITQNQNGDNRINR